jgi:hypothetical protein
MASLPNNRFKRPFFVLVLLIDVFVCVLAITEGAAALVAASAIAAVGTLACLYATRGGRNPRFFQSPLDRRAARSRK